jgi:hypothetical protein
VSHVLMSQNYSRLASVIWKHRCVRSGGTRCHFSGKNITKACLDSWYIDRILHGPRLGVAEGPLGQVLVPQWPL